VIVVRYVHPVTRLEPLVGFYQTHEVAVLLLGTSDKASRARRADAILRPVVASVLVDGEATAFERGVTRPLVVFVQIAVYADRICLAGDAH
jgi:hypothetical protein